MINFIKFLWLVVSWIVSILSMVGAYQFFWFIYLNHLGPPRPTLWGLTVQNFMFIVSIAPLFLLPEYFDIKIQRRTIQALRVTPFVVLLAACLFNLQTYPYRTSILVGISFCFWWVFLISTGIGSISYSSVVRRLGDFRGKGKGVQSLEVITWCRGQPRRHRRLSRGH